MSNEHSSDSESDEDFCPEKALCDIDALSEEDSGEESDVLLEANESVTKQKRRTKSKIKQNIKELKPTDDEKIEEKHNIESDEEEKERTNVLWKDFITDVKSETSKPSSANQSDEKINSKNSIDLEKNKQGTSTKPVKRLYSRCEMPSFLAGLGKKKKVSVLESSITDWNSFKQTEGLQEELKTYNKGKDGFLDRQDFLKRTDLRQFEIEKNLRQTSRRK